MVNAVGYVTGNTVIFFAGFAGSFGRIVVHGSLSFQSKNLKDGFVFSYVIVCPIPLFYAIGAKNYLGNAQIYHCNIANVKLTILGMGGFVRWHFMSLEILIYLFPRKSQWIFSVPVGTATWKN